MVDHVIAIAVRMYLPDVANQPIEARLTIVSSPDALEKKVGLAYLAHYTGSHACAYKRVALKLAGLAGNRYLLFCQWINEPLALITHSTATLSTMQSSTALAA